MKATQRQKLLELLQSRPNQWIPLPEIMRLGLAQYNARILELRHSGYKIENKIQDIEGIRHSWFKLVPQPDIQLTRCSKTSFTSREEEKEKIPEQLRRNPQCGSL